MSDKPRVAVYCRLAKEEKPKAAIYCRVASADEFAVKAQEDMLRNYAMGQMLAIGGVYSDNGESGVTLDRPAFRKMMSSIKNGEVNCIIVKDVSRISRNYLQFGKWLDDMRGRNVRVIVISDGIDSNNYDAVNVSFTEAIEKYYKEIHSQRIKAGIAHSRQRKLEQAAKPSE